MRITFRAVAADDLPLLHRWLNEPGVVEWWEGDDVSWEAVQKDYGPPHTDGTHHYISIVDGTDTGWIQWYAVADSGEELAAWAPHGVADGAAGIDYLIGEPGERGRGVGSTIIDAFVTDVVFAQPDGFEAVAASPYAANVASCRALEKAGFTHVAEIPDDDGPCSLLVRRRSG